MKSEYIFKTPGKYEHKISLKLFLCVCVYEKIISHTDYLCDKKLYGYRMMTSKTVLGKYDTQ